MESLVKCVSNSSSLQTQQRALMVMASVANFFPVSKLMLIISKRLCLESVIDLWQHAFAM